MSFQATIKSTNDKSFFPAIKATVKSTFGYAFGKTIVMSFYTTIESTNDQSYFPAIKATFKATFRYAFG